MVLVEGHRLSLQAARGLVVGRGRLVGVAVEEPPSSWVSFICSDASGWRSSLVPSGESVQHDHGCRGLPLSWACGQDKDAFSRLPQTQDKARLFAGPWKASQAVPMCWFSQVGSCLWRVWVWEWSCGEDGRPHGWWPPSTVESGPSHEGRRALWGAPGSRISPSCLLSLSTCQAPCPTSHMESHLILRNLLGKMGPITTITQRNRYSSIHKVPFLLSDHWYLSCPRYYGYRSAQVLLLLIFRTTLGRNFYFKLIL